MNATQILLAVVKVLEWSGSRQGAGSGPMFSGSDGRYYAACPVCMQLKNATLDFVSEAVGHQQSCALKNLIDHLEGC